MKKALAILDLILLVLDGSVEPEIRHALGDNTGHSIAREFRAAVEAIQRVHGSATLFKQVEEQHQEPKW